MRIFSEFEKKIIREIVKVDNLNSNILTFISNQILHNRGIQIDEPNRTLYLWLSKNDNHFIAELFEIISLLKYLENNFLIFKHKNEIKYGFKGNFVSKNFTQADLNDKSKEFVRQPIPTTLYDIVDDFKRSFMIIGTELKELVINNFKSREEIYHNKELRLARYSFYISLAALFFSFFSPFIFETTIDKKQIEEFQISVFDSIRSMIIDLSSK